MSSFSVPPLRSGIDFDTSSMTGGVANIASQAARVPGIVSSGIDLPMIQAEASIRRLQTAAAGMASSVTSGIQAPMLQAQTSIHAAGASAAEIGEQVEHGMLASQAAMQLFPAIIIEFIENPILGAIALLMELGEKAKEAAESVIDAFKEVGNDAGDKAFGAAKAGVSDEFFSRWVEAGKSVNVSAEQVSQGMKFLQKNAVDAADGLDQSVKAFTDLGISVDFLKSHMNDTESIWTMVHEKLEALPTATEKARRSMEVMGKGGADMALLLAMPKAQLESLMDTAEQFGVIEDAQSAAMGMKWKQASVQIGEAWEGIKRKLTEPLLEFFTDHWDELLPKIIKVADAIAKLIPAAIKVMQEALVLAMHGVDLVLRGVQTALEITDGFGLTDGAGKATQDARDALRDVRVELNDAHFTIDTDKASKEVGEHLAKTAGKVLGEYKSHMTGKESKGRVRGGLGLHKR